MKIKKTNLWIILGVGLIIGGIFWRLSRSSSESEQVAGPQPTPTTSPFAEVQEPQIALSLEQSRSRGKLKITDIDPRFSALEYEFIYQSEYKDSLVERGISSGGAITISEQSLVRDLTFGVESCTTGKCHFVSEKVEVDQPATLILRFLNEKNEIWEVQKTVKFEETVSGYKGVFD